MANYKVASVTGNWSAAGTWDSVPNTPTIHASTNIAMSTTNLYTATFTAPNLVDAVNGCLLYITTVGTAGHNLTVTLQDNSVDTTATATLSSTNLKGNSWVYFRFGTPYTFLSLAAGRYRFKAVYSSAGSHTGAADSGGANLAYICTTNATGVPAATDYAYITSQNLGAAITVTMDGTQQIGSGADTAAMSTVSGRSVGQAVQILANGILAWDTAADATLTSLGSLVIANGGEWRMGTVATPMPAARVAKLIFNENGTSCNYGVGQLDGGIRTLQGTPKSSTAYWKTKYASGVGTAADPAIMADAVNWVVGDEVIIGPASANATNYQESESRFIITKNSATSYVWSATSGGAEAALTYTHTTDAWVLNVQRNVIITTTDITKSYYDSCLSLTKDNTDIDWVRMETIGSTTASKNGFALIGALAAANFDYSVIYRAFYRGFYLNGNDPVNMFTGIIGYLQNSSSFASMFASENSPNNKTFVDCFAVNCNRSGWTMNGANNIYLRCYGLGCNTVGLSNLAGMVLVNNFGSTLTDCEAHCNRMEGMIVGGAAAVIFNNFLCGTKGTNAIDILVTAASYNEITWINSNFGSATFVSNYSTLLQGSELKFHNLNDTANNHVWYSPKGIGRSTGAGLVDTTVRTAGTLNHRFASESLDVGLSWDYLVLAKAQSYVQASGFIYDNAAFVADAMATVTIDLYLPGSTYPDASQVMTNTTDANSASAVFALVAYYAATEPAYATVRITVRTVTAGAYAYLADIFNGTNEITNLNTWYQGQPSPIMFEQLGDAAAVWAVQRSTSTTVGSFGEYVNTDTAATADAVWDEATSGHVVAGTTGKKLKDDLTTNNFIALK